MKNNPSIPSNLFTIVTGASDGIGKALAIQCAKQKMNLVLVARNGEKLKALSEELEKKHEIKVFYFILDLTEPDVPFKLYEQCIVNQKLQVNVLINNAGIGHEGCFESSSAAFYEMMIHLNIRALVSLTRLFVPELKKHSSAHLLNVGSMASFFPIPYKTVYAGTKAFVYSFSRALREELKDTSVKVSVLCPGGVPTNSDVIDRINKQKAMAKISIISVNKVAEIAVKNMLKGKAVIIPGKTNRLLLSLSKIIPISVQIRLTGNNFKQNTG